MKQKIAIVQKCPSKINYEKSYNIDSPDVFNLSSEPVSRLLKRDIDLEGFNPEKYDWVILVGSEALKFYSTATAVTDYTGKIAPVREGESNFIASISPAALAFKPEIRPVFEETVVNIHRILNGEQKKSLNKNYQFFLESNELTEYLETILDRPIPILALDSETSALAPRDGEMLGISIAHEEHQGIYAHADCLDEGNITLIQKLMEQIRSVVFHNAKFDMHFMTYHLGLNFDKVTVHDTMIQHYLLDERQGTHGLKSLAMKYTDLGDYDRGLEEFKDKYCKHHGVKKADFTYDLIPWETIKVYAAQDTDATIQLHNKFYPILCKNDHISSCYHNLMLPALKFLTRMENRGVPVSKERLTEGKKLLMSELAELKAKLYEYDEVKQLEQYQGAVFNPNSTKQLRQLLFDYIGLEPTGKLTATGAISTDAEVLKELGEKHEVPQLILDIRQKSKLINTYIDKLLPVIDLDQRVRTGFNLTSTTSGRLSSSGRFNMQQLPRDNPIIKGCVKAPEGYKIVAADLTTAEIYYAAVLSGDLDMQQVFINMQEQPDVYSDFHSSIAHMVFKLPCAPNDVKKLYPALRQGAKAISFGILYGSGPAKVAQSVNEALLEAGEKPNCTKSQAEEYISTYFARFPKLRQWIRQCHDQIKSRGFIYNFFGRKRRLHNIDSSDRGVAAGELRSGFNAVIQSVSSDHLLLGAIDADIEIESKGLDVEIFALVHDSVVAVVREDLVTEYLEILIRCIQKDRGCSIPGAPIGVEQDSEAGGSQDYSCGKIQKMYPQLAAL